MPRRLLHLGLCLVLLLPLGALTQPAAAQPVLCPMAQTMAKSGMPGCCGPGAPCCQLQDEPSESGQMTLNPAPRVALPVSAGLLAAASPLRQESLFAAVPQPRARAPVPLHLLHASFLI